MERIEIKTINGGKYLYYSKWGKVNGKCRRLWQRYLGTPKALLNFAKKKCRKPKIQYARVFNFGLPMALWQECSNAQIIKTVNNHCGKRTQGLGVGSYIVIAAINRAFGAVSKNMMWEWFSKTSLIRFFPGIKPQDLSSQQFWNHMDKIGSEQCLKIWEEIITRTISKEKIDLSSISYDGTNYYTFIDTFNVRCSLAKRGKNKQGRANVRQINYALFCTSDGHVPLLYDVYEGSRPDVTQFPVSLERFETLFKKFANNPELREKTTLIFDKGNCSKDNYKELDGSELYFVTSTKLDEHKELTFVSNKDERFATCSDDLEGTKAFRVAKVFHGKERTMIVTYDENLFCSQQLTLQEDIRKAIGKLSELSQKLENRANGLVKCGKKPTQASVKSQCNEFLSREYLKDIIEISIIAGEHTRLKFSISDLQLKKVADTYLGKNILVTNRKEWTNDAIIRAYRSQYIIEEVFKESKDRQFGNWWPQYLWTDSKIYVHGLYCTLALLLRAVLWRKVHQAGVKISMKQLLNSLNEIQEVVNVYHAKEEDQKGAETVLTELSKEQTALLHILGVSHVIQR